MPQSSRELQEETSLATLLKMLALLWATRIAYSTMRRIPERRAGFESTSRQAGRQRFAAAKDRSSRLLASNRSRSSRAPTDSVGTGMNPSADMGS